MLIDTHAHLDGEEFRDDLDDVMARAAAAGVEKVLLPAIDLASTESVVAVCKRFPGRAYPMIGLHPEEVKDGWREQLEILHQELCAHTDFYKAIGEIGLDYYWDKTYKAELIDVWNMTRDVIAEAISGETTLKLPGRDNLALLITRIQ